MTQSICIGTHKPSDGALAFIESSKWNGAVCRILDGDASARKYYRLEKENQTAILMDASQCIVSVPPFVQLSRHLLSLGFSVPAIFEADLAKGFLIIEDFGDASFTSLLLEPNRDLHLKLFSLAADILITLHQLPASIPEGIRQYHPQKMLEDIELYLEWRTPDISEAGRKDFQRIWLEVLPVAHQVPQSLLLRDYHVGNLMLLPGKSGLNAVGILDFQDAYQGPVTYDLMSLLEDARRDVPAELLSAILERYLAHFPELDRSAFLTSFRILAAQRHMRVLGIFERLSKRDGKHAYRQLHSPRVERLLKASLEHPALAEVKWWYNRYAC